MCRRGVVLVLVLFGRRCRGVVIDRSFVVRAGYLCIVRGCDCGCCSSAAVVIVGSASGSSIRQDQLPGWRLKLGCANAAGRMSSWWVAGCWLHLLGPEP